MALFVKNQEVDQMAARLAALYHVSKTEAVRRALQHELDRLSDRPGLVEKGLAFVRVLHAGAGQARGVAGKTFIDSLYGEP